MTCTCLYLSIIADGANVSLPFCIPRILGAEEVSVTALSLSVRIFDGAEVPFQGSK